MGKWYKNMKNDSYGYDLDRNTGILICFWLIYLVLTYIIPDNVLERFQILNSFVLLMVEVSPSVKMLGEYSKFPQVSQLLYGIGLVSAIILAVPMYKHFKENPKSFTGASRNGLIVFLSILLILYLIAIIFWFPGAGRIGWSVILRWVYYSKIAFFLSSALILSGLSMLLATLLLCIFNKDIF